MRRILSLCLTAILFVGCVNGFAKYYTPAPNVDAVLRTTVTLPPPKTPIVFTQSADPRADNWRMMEDGYVFIGSSSFYGPANRSNQAQAIEQARSVGAAAVIFNTQYMDTHSGIVPYTVPNPPTVSTVNTSGTVSGYGSGGYVNGNYSSTGTITTPGGYSTYAIPYSINRNTFFASYWVQQDVTKMKLGIRYAALTDEIRKALERNTGVVVAVVVKGTPAFRSNMLEGDVLLKINGSEIIDTPGLNAQLMALAGQLVTFDLLRGNQPRTLAVQLNP